MNKLIFKYCYNTNGCQTLRIYLEFVAEILDTYMLFNNRFFGDQKCNIWWMIKYM